MPSALCVQTLDRRQCSAPAVPAPPPPLPALLLWTPPFYERGQVELGVRISPRGKEPKPRRWHWTSKRGQVNPSQQLMPGEVEQSSQTVEASPILYKPGRWRLGPSESQQTKTVLRQLQ